MAQKRATLYALMREVAATERVVANVWAWGRKQISIGAAMPQQLGLVDVLSSRLYAQQRALYAPIQQFVANLPAAARAEIQPRMPVLSALPPLSSPSSIGLRGRGLGDPATLVIGGVAIPAGALVIGALLVLAITTAVLYFFYANTEMAGDIIMDVQALRADSADAQRRLQAQQGRYADCLARGGTPQSCSSEFPIPPATEFALERERTRRETENLPPWAIGLASIGGLVAVGGLLYVGIRAYSAPGRIVREAVT